MATSRESICDPRVAEKKQPMDFETAPFRDVGHALSFAYRLENAAIIKISSALSDLRASELRSAPLYDTPWDRHAQAAMIIRAVKRSRYRSVIEAKFRMPVTASSINAKHIDCEIVANEFVSEHSPFVVYCVCEWARIRLLKGWVKYYAKTMQCSTRTLYRQRANIQAELEKVESIAISDLDIIMRDAGLIN